MPARGARWAGTWGRIAAQGVGAHGPDATPGRAIHADRGSQYTSLTYRQRLADAGALAHLQVARLEVAHYPGTYLNLHRRHAALGYRSPTSLKPTS